MSPTGRRPGAPDTRETIRSVARRRFATRRDDATSLRYIAAGTGVDRALLIHDFSTTDEPFIAAMELALWPSETLGELWSMPIADAVDCGAPIVAVADGREAVSPGPCATGAVRS
jgi:AcrR family transcriptional regulator